MKKKLLLSGVILTGGLLCANLLSEEKKIEDVRAKHMEYVKAHSYQKTARLSKKERIALGLPPNAYFQQKNLNEMNPYTGEVNQASLLKIQESLNSAPLEQKMPGDIVNPWIDRGPNNVGGRTRALLFDPNDSSQETVFAGGVSGGIWKNTRISDPKSKWVQVGGLDNISVSSIVADPNNSKVFYAGTGESYTGGDAVGNGLWKSTDGGNTWVKIFGGVTGETTEDISDTQVTVNVPQDLAGSYDVIMATKFGKPIEGALSGDLVVALDDTEPANDACEALINEDALKGKIAILKRGSCDFVLKVRSAEKAGAIAVVVVNNQDTPIFSMGGSDKEIKIPSVMISKEDGDKIIEVLESGTVNITMQTGLNNGINGRVVPGVQYINDIAVRNVNGKSEVYIAVGDARALGALVGSDAIGLYKSTDGENFTKLALPKTKNGFAYAVNNIKVGSDGSMYFSTTASAAFQDGAGAIFKSTDGNEFSLIHEVESGLRTEIALSNTNSGVGYILAQISGENPVKIFKTTDDFKTVKEVSLPIDADTRISANDFTRGQSFYDLLIKVDPNDDSVVYVGGIDLFKSTDSGTSWEQLSHWYGGFGYQEVHADQHGLAFASSNRMLFSNDGGVYFSDNAGEVISGRKSNYNTLQFYTVGVAPTSTFDGALYFAAGAQDNGTHLVANGTGGANSSEEVLGGDGAATMFDQDGSDKYLIANYVYNNRIKLIYPETLREKSINSENENKGDFINQETLDSNLNILYSNYSTQTVSAVARYANLLDDVEKTELTNDLLDASPTALKVSPYTKTASVLFLGLRNGKLLKVNNAHEGDGEWSDITGDSFVGTISDIELGASENHILVTLHNYGVKSIWYSEDGGSTWADKEGNLPDIPVKSILQNPLNTKEVIIGTALGVWKTNDFSATSPEWTRSMNGMRDVAVLDLDLRDDNMVFAATHGRGVFSSKFQLNPNGDEDGDGVLNGVDNCPTTANADQLDSDGNGIGDVCQDSDNDGVIDTEDNCPTTHNPNQLDADGNGLGDACQDSDNDGVVDTEDNCVLTANPDQEDLNNNGVGDICDTSFKEAGNISVISNTESCVGEKDGEITVKVKDTYVDYNISLKGGDVDINKPLEGSSETFRGLTPGVYDVCVSVSARDFKQCFEINIQASEDVSLELVKETSDQEYSINIQSGTAPYEVLLNGKVIATERLSSFKIKVENQGLLEIKTSKACEGVFKTAVDGVFLKQNPVKEAINFIIPLNSPENIAVTIYNTNGSVVLERDFKKYNKTSLSIPFNGFKQGTYIVKLGIDNSKSIKIIKK